MTFHFTSGNGFAQLNELCAHIDIPCMSDKLFIKENSLFGNIITDIALESMHQAVVDYHHEHGTADNPL